MPSFSRKFSGLAGCACCLAGLMASLATAEDPAWYDDVQYLTWDVRADEAEAAAAVEADQPIYLQPTEGQRDCGWYESCAGGCDCDDYDVYDPSLCAGWQTRIECLCEQLQERGIVYSVVAPQFYQGVTSGGVDEGFEYGGENRPVPHARQHEARLVAGWVADDARGVAARPGRQSGSRGAGAGERGDALSERRARTTRRSPGCRSPRQ